MRKFLINVNGSSYEVEVEEVGAQGSAAFVSAPAAPAAPAPAAPAAPAPAAPQAAAPAPAAVAVPAGATKISAPMPGTILDIPVQSGASVKEGDVLLVLEAMKMENEILAPCDGKVTSIATSKGASVNTGDLLVVIE